MIIMVIYPHMLRKHAPYDLKEKILEEHKTSAISHSASLATNIRLGKVDKQGN